MNGYQIALRALVFQGPRAAASVPVVEARLRADDDNSHGAFIHSSLLALWIRRVLLGDPPRPASIPVDSWEKDPIAALEPLLDPGPRQRQAAIWAGLLRPWDLRDDFEDERAGRIYLVLGELAACSNEEELAELIEPLRRARTKTLVQGVAPERLDAFFEGVARAMRADSAMARSLGHSPGLTAPSAWVEAAVEHCRADDPVRRRQALDTLGMARRHGAMSDVDWDELARPAFLSAFSSTNSGEPEAATVWLVELGEAAPGLGDAAIVLLTGPSGDVRAEFLRGLGQAVPRLPEDEAARVHTALGEVAARFTPELRRTLVQTLTPDPRHPHGILLVIERLLADPDRDIALAAARRWCEVGGDADRARASIVPRLDPRDSTFALGVAEALAEAAGPELVEAIARLARSGSEASRVRALAALGSIGASAAPVEETIRGAFSSPRPMVRRAAAKALLEVAWPPASSSDREALASVYREWLEEEGADAWRAARALGELGVRDASVLEALRVAIGSDRHRLATVARETLGHLLRESEP